ncbi:TPA: hypothetical protein N2D16_002822 [Clostridium botulinum]|nr:hypothetical protein [Clostridium botulinum]
MMFIDEFQFDNDKYGTVAVTINEDEKGKEIRVWGIYFEGEEEKHIVFNYPKKVKKSEQDIIKEINKRIS